MDEEIEPLAAPAADGHTNDPAKPGEEKSAVPVIAEDALAHWKDELRAQFESWLEGVDDIPEPEEERTPPDLYSFYEELSALRNENRRGNRKSAEVFGKFGESLETFEGEVKRLREQMMKIDPSQTADSTLPRSHCLGLVEILDRLRRLQSVLERPPARGRFAFLQPDQAWRDSWENLRQAFSILVTHAEKLLEQAGVRPLRTLGEPFDPTRMVAIAILPAGDRAANIVAEEAAAGYCWRDEVLRPAEVKITRASSSNL